MGDGPEPHLGSPPQSLGLQQASPGVFTWPHQGCKREDGIEQDFFRCRLRTGALLYPPHSCGQMKLKSSSESVWKGATREYGSERHEKVEPQLPMDVYEVNDWALSMYWGPFYAFSVALGECLCPLQFSC